jgi:signal transduction histidine kinase
VPLVRGDGRRLEQVISNLVSNAINFTPVGGNIELGIAHTEGADVRVWVKDNGVGIPRAEVTHLFEKYRQGRNATESGHKGTGLGLVICKMVVEAHGGNIWVETEEGEGAVFTFSLPTAE